MVFPPFETHISYQLPWDSKRWAPPWAVEAAPRCSWQQRSPCFSQVPVGYTHSHWYIYIYMYTCIYMYIHSACISLYLSNSHARGNLRYI
jgi:hypothetical protein